MLSNLFKKDELKLLWPFYLMSIILGFTAVIMPFFIVYLLDVGLTYFQISVMFTAYALILFFFEVPTGAFADGFSRKYSVLLGYFFAAILIFLVPFFSSFYGLFIIWGLVGFATTFITGADNALVIDNLNHLKRKDLHHEYFTKRQSLGFLGGIFGPIVGVIIVKYFSMSYLWYVYGLGLFLSVVILLFVTEHYKPKKANLIGNIKNTYKNSIKGFKFAYNHKVVFLLILGGMLLVLMNFTSSGWEPLMLELGMPLHYLGFVFSAMALVGMALPLFAKSLFKDNIKKLVLFSILLRIILLSLVVYLFSPWFIFAIILFLLDAGVSFFSGPALRTYFHKFVPSEVRATVGSIESMAIAFGMATFGLLGGVLLDFFGTKAIAFGAIFGVLAFFVYMKAFD